MRVKFRFDDRITFPLELSVFTLSQETCKSNKPEMSEIRITMIIEIDQWFISDTLRGKRQTRAISERKYNLRQFFWGGVRSIRVQVHNKAPVYLEIYILFVSQLIFS